MQQMTNVIKNKSVWIYSIAFSFILINAVLTIFDFYWFALLPAIMLIMFLYFFAFDKLYLFLIFLIPLSVNIVNPDLNFGMALPTEPLLFALMFMFFIKILYQNNFDLKISKHPVSILIIFSILWMLLTSITSQIPIVSFKFLLSRLWFVVCFYFIATQLFKDLKNIKRFIWLYSLSMIIVIGYTLINHAQYNFNEVTSHWVMSPFFNDHTSYASSIAFLIPLFIYFSFNKNFKISLKILSFIILLILIISIVLSYTRAAWVSLAVSLSIYLIIIFKINYKILLLGIILIAGYLFINQDEIFYKLAKNKQESSADMVKHVQSIANIRSDASNLERINRWNSALRMFKDNPVFGTGPGTYQFLYAPYQHSREKTIISTNTGNRGNAHSEYLGPLAESGILGSLSFIAIIITALIYALKNHKTIKDKTLRSLNLAITLGLITYLVHGVLNNFLDTDKASALFWGFIAMIVAINVYHARTEN